MPQRENKLSIAIALGGGRRLAQGSTNSELLGLLPCAARSRLGPKALHHFFRAAGENVVPAKSLEPPYPAIAFQPIYLCQSVSSLAISNASRAACEPALSRMTSCLLPGDVNSCLRVFVLADSKCCICESKPAVTSMRFRVKNYLYCSMSSSGLIAYCKLHDLAHLNRDNVMLPAAVYTSRFSCLPGMGCTCLRPQRRPQHTNLEVVNFWLFSLIPICILYEQ